MKSLTKLIVIVFAALSMNVFAASAIDSLNIETIKQTMTAEQVQVALDKWKADQMANIKLQAPLISERVPADIRDKMLTAQVEQKYNQLMKELGL